MPRGLLPTTGTALLTLGFVALVIVDRTNGTLRDGTVTTTIVWFLVAFAGYLALLDVQRPSYDIADAGAGESSKRRFPGVSFRMLLLLGLGLRLILMFTEPTLSDDVYRYLWEGHLVTQGVSPYSFPIDSPLSLAYEIPARSLANNQSLASPYFPVAHGIFATSSLVLGSEPWSMQLVMIGFDTLALTMMLKLLALAKLPSRRVLLYWLNPLVIVEVAHGAHIDAIIIGLAATGLWFTLDNAKRSSVVLYLSPLVLAAATLTRPLAILFTPVLFWMWNWRQRVVFATGLLIPLAIVGATVGLGLTDGGGTGVFGSAGEYTRTFRFNGGLYHWLEQWISSRGLDDCGWNEPVALTRLVVAIAVIALLAGVFLRSRGPHDERTTMRLLALPMVVYVLFTPVLHPWYILLLLALLPFMAPGADEPAARWIVVAPWIALSGLLIFSYLTYENPAAFAERDWVRQLQWYPTLALAAAALAWHVRQMRKRSPLSSSFGA